MNTPTPEGRDRIWNPVEIQAPEPNSRPVLRRPTLNFAVLPPEVRNPRLPTKLNIYRDTADYDILHALDAAVEQKNPIEGRVVTPLGTLAATRAGIFGLTNQKYQKTTVPPKTTTAATPEYDEKVLYELFSGLKVAVTELIESFKYLPKLQAYTFGYAKIYGEYTKFKSLSTCGAIAPQNVQLMKTYIVAQLKKHGVCEYARDVFMPSEVDEDTPTQFATRISEISDTLPEIFSENPEKPSKENELRRTAHPSPLTVPPFAIPPEAAIRPVAPITAPISFDAAETLPVGITAIRDFTITAGVQEQAAISVPVPELPPVPGINENPVLVVVDEPVPAPQSATAEATDPQTVVAQTSDPYSVENFWGEVTPAEIGDVVENGIAKLLAESIMEPPTNPLEPSEPVAQKPISKPTINRRALLTPTTAFKPAVQNNIQRYGRLVAGILATVMGTNQSNQIDSDPRGTVIPITTPAMTAPSRPYVTFSEPTRARNTLASSAVSSTLGAIKNLFTAKKAAPDLTEYEKKYLATHQARIASAQQKAAEWKAGNRVKEFEMITPLTTDELTQLNRPIAAVAGTTAVNRLYAKKDVMITMGDNVNPAINLYKTATSAAKPQPKSFFGKLGSKVKSWFA